MHKWGLFGLLLGLILSFLFIYLYVPYRQEDRTENMQTVSLVKSKNSEQEQTNQKQFPGQPIKESINQSVIHTKAIFEKNDQIPFEVINGIATAYGDIMLGKLLKEDRDITKGVTLPEKIMRWGSEVPYRIDPSLKNSDRVITVIDYFKRITPVPIVEYSGQEDYIVFSPGKENCLSHLGKVGGPQPIFLADDCDFKEIVHEVMHALGFIHEQSRTDRNQFIKVHWENIEERYQLQFAIAPEIFMEFIYGIPFDYESIMLYESTAFARAPGLTTLESVSGSRIMPNKRLSKGDLEKLSIMSVENQ